jgi:hypothetical protein
MESLDLNIDHYSIDDIISLFKISNKLTSQEMKAAKRTVLMSHPDKSRLDSKYFLFFTKAYKILYSIFTHKNKTIETEHCVERTRIRDDKESEVEIDSNLKRLSSSSKCDHDFTIWFNRYFEENKESDDIVDQGYGEWLKEEVQLSSGKSDGPVSKDKRDDIINREKSALRAVTVYKTVDEIDGHVAEHTGQSSLLSRDTVDYYGSGIFSSNNLCFDDVKHAYTETVIPVTEKDFLDKQKYNSVNQLQNERVSDQRSFRFIEDDEKNELNECRTIFNFISK